MPTRVSAHKPKSGERIQKILAAGGLCSRREAEAWIRAGRLRVDGRVARLGQRLRGDERLTLDGRRLRPQPAKSTPRVLLYHKPVGEICTRRDEGGRRTVYRSLPPLARGRWLSIGRLDVSTSGLLLFSDDGELVNRLAHPSSRIEREYLARVRGAVDEAMLKRLRRGVRLADGRAAFSDIQPGGDGGGANRWFYMVLMEGRNREVRRLWESQGVQVSRLKRLRFGPVFLPPSLRPGRWRELSGADLASLLDVKSRSRAETRGR